MKKRAACVTEDKALDQVEKMRTPGTNEPCHYCGSEYR